MKGVETLLAFGSLPPDTRLVIIGGSDIRYLEKLHELSRNAGGAERVIWAGHSEEEFAAGEGGVLDRGHLRAVDAGRDGGAAAGQAQRVPGVAALNRRVDVPHRRPQLLGSAESIRRRRPRLSADRKRRA